MNLSHAMDRAFASEHMPEPLMLADPPRGIMRRKMRLGELRRKQQGGRESARWKWLERMGLFHHDSPGDMHHVQPTLAREVCMCACAWGDMHHVQPALAREVCMCLID